MPLWQIDFFQGVFVKIIFLDIELLKRQKWLRSLFYTKSVILNQAHKVAGRCQFTYIFMVISNIGKDKQINVFLLFQRRAGFKNWSYGSENTSKHYLLFIALFTTSHDVSIAQWQRHGKIEYFITTCYSPQLHLRYMSIKVL